MRAKVVKKSHMRKGYAIFFYYELWVISDEPQAAMGYRQGYFLLRERMTVKVSKVAITPAFRHEIDNRK